MPDFPKGVSRDSDIQRVFEIADDSLLGVLGHHYYVIAIHISADPNEFKIHLPTISGKEAIPHTFSWYRYYRKQDLIDAFKPPSFEFYQSRLSLTTMASMFEVALENFIKYLNAKGHQQYLKKEKMIFKNNRWTSYKKRLKWAYKELKNCEIGTKKAIKRLPKTFGMIDNARRLRNLILHNHGLFNENYGMDAIKCKGIIKNFHHDYQLFKKSGKSIPIRLFTKNIINFSRAHIEVLHLLHNHIQKKYFKYPEEYDYGREGKPIGWGRILWADVKIRDFTPIIE